MGFQEELKTSVIILNYNSASYIVDCIQSVLDQTRPPDEIIFCDDASTDDSVEIAKSFPNISLITHYTNIGPLYNAISGINHSTGEILFFLDSDDLWENKKIETVLGMYNASNTCFLVSHSHIHVNQGNQVLEITDDTHRNIALIDQSTANLDKRSCLYKQSILYRKGGFWLGSAYSFRRSCLNIVELTDLLKSIPSSRYAYGDLVIAPYLIYTNPLLTVSHSDFPFLRYRRHLSNATPETNNSRAKLKSIQRIRNTNTCTLALFSTLYRSDPSLSSVVSRYQLLEREYDYIKAIYSQNLLQSLKLFISLAPFFASEKKLFKELLRLLLLLALGSNLLCKLQYVRSLHKFSPSR